MSKALAIEISGRVGSVAVLEDGRVLAEEMFAHGLKHAAGILVIIERLVNGQGWTPREVQYLYVSAGPGSFTGLRVGITVAKTLGLALGLKVVAVPTVSVLALNAPSDWRELIIVLDAKRDQIFTARFANRTGQAEQIEPAHLGRLDEMLARSTRPVHLLGEGIPYHRKFIPSDDPGVIVTPEDSWRPRAAAVAQVGWAMARQNEFADIDRLTPIYIRMPEAQEKWEANQGRRPTADG